MKDRDERVKRSADRPRALIVLSSDHFVRNYMGTGAFAALGSVAEVAILASERVTMRDALEQIPGFRGYFGSDDQVERRHYELFNVLMWQHRDKSPSFRFRIRRVMGADYLHHAVRGSGPVLSRLASLARFIKNFVLRPRTWAFAVLGSGPLGRLVVRRRIRDLPVNGDLDRRVEQFAPDVIVFPSSAYDPIGNDLARIASARGIRTLFLVDNWDNLSSKSILWVKPDFLGVWGPQSVRHAVEIQGMPLARVQPIGTPRFDAYYALRDGGSRSPFPYPYVLFVGCALPFAEVHALAALDCELAAHPDIYGDARVVYRPHPWRQGRINDDEFVPTAYERVVLDPQMADLVAQDRPMPGLAYYGPLLQNAAVVVAPLTTMLIEALIFRRPTVVLAYDDGVHYSSPHNALRNYEHFQGVGDIPGVRLVEQKSALAGSVRAAWLDGPLEDPNAVDEALGHYLHHDPRPYAQRLRDLLLEVSRREDQLTGSAAVREPSGSFPASIRK